MDFNISYILKKIKERKSEIMFTVSRLNLPSPKTSLVEQHQRLETGPQRQILLHTHMTKTTLDSAYEEWWECLNRIEFLATGQKIKKQSIAAGWVASKL